MMRWEARTEATSNIGTLELGNLTFDEDYMEVSIDICDMSDSLKAEVEKVIEIGKIQLVKDNEALNAEKGYTLPTTWSNKPVVMDFAFLRVMLKAGEPTTYKICIGFHDADNEHMSQWDCEIAVDLSKYANELKKTIIKALVDKFF